MIVKKKLKKFQVRALYEYYQSLISKPGESVAYSYHIFTNFNMLADVYEEVSKGPVIENRKDIEDYNNEYNIIVGRYADRDENNNIIWNAKGEPTFIEMAAEYSTERNKLLEKYPGIEEKLEEYRKIQNDYYKEEIEIELDCLELNDIVCSAPPYVVGLTKL